MEQDVKVVIGSDHRGFGLKRQVITLLQQMGCQYQDEGCFDEESVDYPDVAQKVACRVAEKSCDVGILICGTGIGMSIAANKVPGIRAALCVDPLSARMARQHNDANVLCMGGEMVGAWQAVEVVKTFLSTSFDGGRHLRRVEKIKHLEERAFLRPSSQ